MECVMKKNEKALTVAFTGGGGKTSLILGLAEIFPDREKRVIVTTTTHMAWEPERLLRRQRTFREHAGL